MRLKTIIADENVSARDSLEILLTQFAPDVEILASAGTVTEAVQMINSIQPDLVFVDLEQGECGGFEVMDKVGKKNFDIVFTSGDEKDAFKAFRYHALDYLIKPIIPAHLISAVERSARRVNGNHQIGSSARLVRSVSVMKSKLPLPYQNGVKYVEVSKVIRLEADGSYTTIYIEGERPQVVSKPLKFYTEMLNEEVFLRLHRSHIVNSTFVQEYNREGGGCLILLNGERIHVAEKKREGVLRRLSFS